ncbi:MAG: AMP-binding protein [Bacteroidales bacterium]|nr:AMP-binding protein [Bacteroidales bacterium]
MTSEKRTVLRMLRSCAAQHPDYPYTCQKSGAAWACLTYSEALQESLFFASGLLENGIKKGNKIAILAEGRNHWITSEFGILFAGATNVPLALKLIPEEISFRIIHSESVAVVVSKIMLKKLAPLYGKLNNRIKLISLDRDLDEVMDLCRQNGLEPGKNLLFYRDIVESGKTAWKKNKPRLQQIEKGIGEDDLVTISYTSGTTGDPKGIMLTHLNYWSNCHDAMEYFNVTPGDRLYICLPVDHSFAHTVGLYAALLRGLSLYFVDFGSGGLQYAKNVAKNLVESNPHFMLSVPALTGNFMSKITDGVAAKGKLVKWIFNTGMNAGIRIHGDGFRKGSLPVRIANYLPYKLADWLVFKKIRKIFGRNIRYIVGGGALLDIRQQKFFYTLGVPVYQGYGLSEATPIISANTQEIHKMGSSGRVIPNVECKILRSDGTEASRGEQGEIVIRGANVMKGYFNNPESTSKTIIDNWLHTGDLGYIDEDDFLIVIGREKALLISSDGEKYSPEGIEEAIQNCANLIHQVMVYNDMKQYTSAIITLNKEKVHSFITKQGISNAAALLEALKTDLNRFRETPEFKNQFPEKWIPVTFQIATEDFSDENQMINSALKMVRHKIQEVYHKQIEFMYTPTGSKIVNELNLHAIEEFFKSSEQK